MQTSEFQKIIQTEKKKRLVEMRQEIWRLRQAWQTLLEEEKYSMAGACRIQLDRLKKEYQLKKREVEENERD